MAIQDAPDGTVWIQIVDVVVDIPVPPAPAHEWAIAKVARYSGGAVTYQTVVSWTVTAAKIGILHQIEMMSDIYSKTRFQLTIDGVQQFTDVQLATSLMLMFPDVRLAAGAVVLLEAKSSDSTAINVDGDITGKEVG